MPLTAPPSAPPAAPAAPGDAPSRANPSSFRTLADAFVVWLVGLRTSMADWRTWMVSYLSWQTTNISELAALQTDVAAKQSAATTAASSATTAASAAVGAAAAAAHIYPGTFASDPTTRPDGSAIQNGDQYVTTTGTVKVRSAGAWATPTVNMTDIANVDDVAKGSALVGHRGTTMKGSIDLSLRRPRKTYAKLFAAASGVSRLKLVEFGDSLGGAKMQMLRASLDRRFGGTNANTQNTAGTTSGAGVPSAGRDCDAATLVSATQESGMYAYWPTGTVVRIDAGGSSAWQTGGANPTFTTVTVYYAKEPGAGTINLLVGGVTQATASANATAALGTLTYTQAVAQASVSTTVTGASVRVLFVHIENSGVSGLDYYSRMQLSGLALTNAMSSAQGMAIFQAAMTAIAPDLVTFEMDDNLGDGGPIAAAYQSLCTILDAACPTADKVIIGSTPRSVDDAGKLAASNYLRGDTAARGASYLFFDSYHLMGTYADMGTIFGADDGTHPSTSAQAYAAEILWAFLGMDSTNMGFLPRAVNDPGTPSKLASLTTFGPGSAPPDVSIDSNAFQGFWRTNFSYGISKKDGTCKFQISYNGSWPSILPSSFDFDSSGNVRKLDLSTSTGIEFMRFRKTDNPGGGAMHLSVGLLKSSFTRTELLAISAISNIGAIAYCSDCTGGAQWVYAKGGSSTDWVTIDGKTGI